MNKKIGMIGSAINAFTVLAFAICMLIDFTFGSYFVCIFLALSFVMMISAFEAECLPENKAAGKAALVFSAIYATLIVIVYFTQCTSVINDNLNDQAQRILSYKYMGLMFNLDLLGYGIMALSTFFIGLTINAETKADRALKALLLIHGVFFLSCLIMPITGIFANSDGSTSSGGVIALEIWCLYFLPISRLSALHLKRA
ncbi:MAG: hypothetical protein J6W46_05850 [Spirochaetaceae bacterium]|nr:hypothetical protein [Spirochaetaceae bacterium]